MIFAQITAARRAEGTARCRRQRSTVQLISHTYGLLGGDVVDDGGEYDRTKRRKKQKHRDGGCAGKGGRLWEVVLQLQCSMRHNNGNKKRRLIQEIPILIVLTDRVL